MENNKTAEAASTSTGGAVSGQTVNGNGGTNPDPSTIPNPKLGMAPLSSELAVAAASNNIPADPQQPSNPPPPNPLQPADPQNARTSTSIPQTVDPPRPDPAATGPTQVSTAPVPSEPEQVPQVNDPPLLIPDSAAPQPDPTTTVNLAEQPHPPNPNPTPSDVAPVDSPTNIGLRPHNADNAPEEMN